MLGMRRGGVRREPRAHAASACNGQARTPATRAAPAAPRTRSNVVTRQPGELFLLAGVINGDEPIDGERVITTRGRGRRARKGPGWGRCGASLVRALRAGPGAAGAQRLWARSAPPRGPSSGPVGPVGRICLPCRRHHLWIQHQRERHPADLAHPGGLGRRPGGAPPRAPGRARALPGPAPAVPAPTLPCPPCLALPAWRQLINTTEADEWNYPGAMVLDSRGRLVVMYGIHLAALDAATGDILQVRAPGAGGCPGAAGRAQGGRQAAGGGPCGPRRRGPAC